MRVNKHRAIDSRGHVYTRSSQRRLYSHCVVVFLKPMTFPGYQLPARTHAEWASRRDLAERQAAYWRGLSHVEAVEIIPATLMVKA